MRLTAAGIAVQRGGQLVLDNLSFSVGSGEMLAVVGPNGAGKSTLLRLVAGMLRPLRGEIALAGASTDEIGHLTHYLGHLDGLKQTLTVEENVSFWRRLSAAAGDVGDALEAVGLGHLPHLPAASLSAGQRRRVAIARLLVAKRPLWLLDEPTTALDAAAEANLGGLIGRHLAEGGIAIAATHRRLPVAPTATLTLGARP